MKKKNKKKQQNKTKKHAYKYMVLHFTKLDRGTYAVFRGLLNFFIFSMSLSCVVGCTRFSVQ